MTNRKFGVLLVTAALLLAAVVCEQPKEAPIISSINGSKSVEARDSADYKCNASDPDWKQLSYSWLQTGGRLGWDWGDSVRWFAPESSGKGIIRVTVTDEDGMTVSDSITVTVRAETANVLYWDAAVKAGDFSAWSDTVRAGYKLFGHWLSDAGVIYFKVMDDSNFDKWVVGEPSVWLLRCPPDSTNDTFSIQIGESGPYHLIVDNTEGKEDYNYYLRVWKAGP